jgi:hypothetical protein
VTTFAARNDPFRANGNDEVRMLSELPGSVAALALFATAPIALAQGSGKFERTQPSAPAPSAKPAPAKPAPPRPSASPTEEIKRKARAGERENGFCATAPFPRSTGLNPDLGRGGEILRNEYAEKGSSDCKVHRVFRVGRLGGLKCVVYETFRCDVGQKCAYFMYGGSGYKFDPGKGWTDYQLPPTADRCG